MSAPNKHLTGITAFLIFFLFLAAAHVLARNHELAQIKEESTKGGAPPPSRPCQSASHAGKTKRTKKPDKERQTAPEVAVEPGCLEALATAIEVQEYLQGYVRQQRWAIANERVAEDSWTFYVQLDSEEIPKYAKPETGEERVVWTGGQAYVRVETGELTDGFTRLHVKVLVEGYGQNHDRFAPQRRSWELPSNGALEANLTAALAAHMNSKR